MSNPIDQLKGVDNTAPIVTPEDVTPITVNEPVAQQSVYAGEAGIDPSLNYPDGALLQSPQSEPNIQEAPPAESPASFPNIEPSAPQISAPDPLNLTPVQSSGAPLMPSGQQQTADIQAPVYGAAAQDAGFQADNIQSAIERPQLTPTTWAPVNLEASISNFGANAEALRVSYERQVAERTSNNEKAWLEANLQAIEKMQKPENSATGNGLGWVQAALGALDDATSTDGGRQYVNFLKYKGTGNEGEGEWVGSGIGAVLYGLGLAQNSAMGAALDVVQLYRNVDKGISDAYQRFTPAWARGSTDNALKVVGQLLPQAKIFRDSTLKENRYYDGRSNLVEALRGAQYSFSDKQGSGFGIDNNQGLGTIATWNPKYGQPGQSMFIDSGVDINPSLLAGVALDVVTGNIVDGALGKLAAKAALKPGAISKVTGLTAAGWDGAGSFAERAGKVDRRAVTPAQQAQAAAERAVKTDRSPLQGEIPFLNGPVASTPVVPPKLPKGMRPKATKPARSPVDRGGAVQLELRIQDMMPSKPSAGELAVRPDAYKPGLRGRKGADAGGQLELRLEGVQNTKLPKAEKLPKPPAKPPAPLQFKFDPFEPGKFNARDFEPKNAKVAPDGTQFTLPLGKANKSTPVPTTPSKAKGKVPVKLDSTVEQLGFDPFNPGELNARGYEAVNTKKTQYVNKKTGNQLTLSVPVEEVPAPTQIPFTAPGSISRKPLAGRQGKINFDVMPEAVPPTTRVANPNVAKGARKDTIAAVEMLDPVAVSEKRVAANAVKAGMDPDEVVAEVKALRAEHTNLANEIEADNFASAAKPTQSVQVEGGEAALRKEYDVLSKKLDRASERTMESITTRMGEIEGQLKQLVNPQPSALDELLEVSAEGRNLNRKSAMMSVELDRASASYAQELEKGSTGRQMLQEPGVDTIPYPRRGPYTPVSTVERVYPVKDGQFVYHGTQVKDVPVNLMNPLDGAASSELGLGVYFTRNDEIALEAAKATRNIDVPSLPSRAPTDGSGQLRKVSGVEDLHIVSGVDPNPQILKLAFDAVDSGDGRFQAILDLDNATEPQTIVDILDEAQQAFKDPDTLRAFQRAFTEKLIEDGIDGVELSGNIAIYRTAGLKDLGVMVETGVQTAGDATYSRYLVDDWAKGRMGSAKSSYISTITAQSDTSRYAQSLADLEYFKDAVANKAFAAVERSGLMDNPSRIPTLDEFVRLGVSDITDTFDADPSGLGFGWGKERPDLIEAFNAYAERRQIKVKITEEVRDRGAAGTMNSMDGTLSIDPRYENALQLRLHEIGHDLMDTTLPYSNSATLNELAVETASQVVMEVINPQLAKGSQTRLTWFFEQTQPGGFYDEEGNVLTAITRAQYVKENGELVAKLATKLLEEIAPGIDVPPISASRIFTPEAFSQYIDEVVSDNGSKPLSSLLKKSYVTIEGADKPTISMIEKFATNPVTGMVNDNAVDTLLARYGGDVVPIELPKSIPIDVEDMMLDIGDLEGNESLKAAVMQYVVNKTPITDFSAFGPEVQAAMDAVPSVFKDGVVDSVDNYAKYPVELQRLIDLATYDEAATKYALRMARGDDPYEVLDALRKEFPYDVPDAWYNKAKADIDEYMQYVNCR